jgi:hypothetical protein
MNKSNLLSEIDMLKVDIQYLIDKKKTQNLLKDEVSKIDNEKKIKMDRLKLIREQLKNIQKKERAELQKQNEYNSVIRTLNSLDYQYAKSRGTSQAMEKARKAKEDRDLAREKYLNILELEKMYNSLDTPTFPGMLFLHPNIIKSYGKCPYINIDFEKDTTETLYNNRKEWLEKTSDKGEEYMKMYNMLIKQEDLKILTESLCKQDDEIDLFITKLLNDDQYKLYIESKSFIQEYVNCLIKSKKIKEKYKMLIYNLSILLEETNINIHEYISLKYNHNIVVNDLNRKKEKDESNKIPKELKAIYSYEFDNKVKKYKELKDTIEKMIKYNQNTLKNLNNELYEYLLKSSKKNNIKKQAQEGKYFKKWTQLTTDEKIDRLKSYSNYYVNQIYEITYPLVENVSEITTNLDKKKELIEEAIHAHKESLEKLLIDELNNKNIIYKNIKWNVKLGYIENIYNLKYSSNLQETNPFTIQKNKEIKTSGIKRKASNKSVITKDIEKIINEQILLFIVSETQSSEIQETKSIGLSISQDSNVSKSNENSIKNKMLETIKNKLRIKKLSKSDKDSICKKYEEMLEIVKNNKTD